MSCNRPNCPECAGNREAVRAAMKRLGADEQQGVQEALAVSWLKYALSCRLTGEGVSLRCGENTVGFTREELLAVVRAVKRGIS